MTELQLIGLGAAGKGYYLVPQTYTEYGIFSAQLSDKLKEPARDALPDAALAPGESFVFAQENVSLSAQRDELYLFDASGAL